MKQSLKQSNGSDSNSLLANDVPRSKDEALVHHLNLLAEGFGEPLTATRLKLYIMGLGDLSASQLKNGLNRAIRELTFWPRPAELRELCTGVKARKSDTLRADEAWQWVMTYLDRHGVRGRTMQEFQGREDFDFCDGDIRYRYLSVMDRKHAANEFAFSAPFYILATYPAPEIPKLISATLIQLGGGVSAGLMRLVDARKAAEPIYDGSANNHANNPKEIGFLRRDFTEFYLNAAALEAERSAPATIDPSRQLAGDVPSPFKATRLPIKLYFGEYDSLKYKALPLDEAIYAHAAGDLDEDAYAATNAYWKRLKLKEEEQCVIQDYWACFIPHVGRDHDRDIPTPTEGTEVFRVESFDGGGVVYKGKLLRVDERQVKVGDRFHIRVSPTQFEAVPSLSEIEVNG
jgi:hypothetical protein